jgi:hypothetical protein
VTSRLEDAYGLHVIDGNRSLPLERCAALIASYARAKRRR